MAGQESRRNDIYVVKYGVVSPVFHATLYLRGGSYPGTAFPYDLMAGVHCSNNGLWLFLGQHSLTEQPFPVARGRLTLSEPVTDQRKLEAARRGHDYQREKLQRVYPQSQGLSGQELQLRFDMAAVNCVTTSLDIGPQEVELSFLEPYRPVLGYGPLEPRRNRVTVLLRGHRLVYEQEYIPLNTDGIYGQLYRWEILKAADCTPVKGYEVTSREDLACGWED